MDLNLEKHVALITGGASGIGLATAEMFAAEGCRVVIWDRQIPEASVGRVFQTDLSVPEEVQAALESTLSEFGRIDHLVHTAAIGSEKFGFPFDELSPADWGPVLDVNIMGMTHVAHAVAPAMREQKAGTMVFLSSVAGQIGSQTDPPYSAAKAANINFAQCLARDMAPQGVRVNTVCPGMVKSPLNKSVWQAWNNRQSEAERRSYAEWGDDKVKALIPLGRWQSPEDIAHTILFLSSDKAAQITGQTINVDGGYVIR